MKRTETDLFGDVVAEKITNDRPESGALREVIKALRSHPAVAWVERQNSGQVKIEGRYITFGWRGASDIIGMLKDGRLLAVEVKGPAGRLQPHQRDFLERVRSNGGVAFVARSLADVVRELATKDCDDGQPRRKKVEKS